MAGNRGGFTPSPARPPPPQPRAPGLGSTRIPVAMSHIALQEAIDGKNVDWPEKVSDAQYGR